ncbi:MAG TPA: hypothetical protein VGH82_12495 [Gaiellaceae bacterium]|jgi:hypothetical protein
MRLLSVKTGECGIDLDGRPQDTGETALCSRPLETLEPAARVDPAAGRGPAGDEAAAGGGEALKLALRRLPPATCAPPDRLRH